MAVAMGVVVFAAGFLAESMGPPFSYGRGPRYPVTKAQRIILVVFGVLFVLEGLGPWLFRPR
jgi:hypothetical protein